MVSVPRSINGNRMLSSLSRADFALVESKLVPVLLAVRQDLEKPNKSIEHAFFPDSGIVSVVALNAEGNHVEIGIIGNEGVTALPVLLGNGHSPHSTYIQLAGRGRRITTADLNHAMSISPSLRMHLLKYVQAFMAQAAHTAVANARASLPERLARWLLMAHDRVRGDGLALTHEFLALMIGVRRAGVTEALHELVEHGHIKTHRGQITILDRDAIEEIAGSFYGVPEREYDRLLS
jgi:CRP-like cAMP-binding protein